MALSRYFDTMREITRHPLNVGRPWGAIADYFGWNIGRRLLREDHILPLAEGAFVIVSDRQNFGTLCYTCALWDFEEMLFLIHLLGESDLFIDIGANAGVYSILASAVAGARSISIEPVPSTFAELERNIRANGVWDRVRPLRMGAGDHQGALTMTESLGGLNHIVADGWQGPTISVPVSRLDDILDGESCRLIKLDAEGFEMNILHGAPETLANPKLVAMIVELNGSGGRYGHSDQSVHAEITKYGFQPYRYDPAARLLSPRSTFRGGHLNTLYVRSPETVRRIVADARKVRVRDREF